MYNFANSMNTATSSMQNFNSTANQTTTAIRGIVRSGDMAIYRQGVEDT
jgi:hypothetical protein